MIEVIGGRKFVAAIGAGVATTFLQFMGKLDPNGTTYAAVVIATLGAFIGGNVYQKIKRGADDGSHSGV